MRRPFAFNPNFWGDLRLTVKRTRAFTVTVATSVALVAGMTGPTTAITANTATTPNTTRFDGDQRIRLITGDRVVVGAKGQVVGFEAAKGRERIPVQVQRIKDHTLVVPSDAQRLIATGKLDQRLFDVAELTDPQLRKSQGDGLKLIVQYDGGADAARAEVRSAGDTRLRRTFPALDADAIRTPQDDVTKVWEALTDQRKSGLRATSSGIKKVWLDGVRRASLDRGVEQIGADKAWEAGYDGTGVKIAVLDTGVDKTHDDLKTQVVGEKNFSGSPDTVDHVGHGTHVASIAAGTGAKSGGTYKGVAPGAEVISGKVLNDEDTGTTPPSSRAWSGPRTRARTWSTSAWAARTPRASTRWRRRSTSCPPRRGSCSPSRRATTASTAHRRWARRAARTPR